MAKVLARREVNRKTLEQYILDEDERFEILGPGRVPLHRTRRDYTWYARDDMHVRSPVRFNGVSVGEEARQRYEADWIRRELSRRERQAKKQEEKEEETAAEVSGVTGVPTEPRFVSEAYFMDFKFEPGNYYLAGRETLEGQEVLTIEYYPTTMFGDNDDDRGRKTPPAGASKTSREEGRVQRQEKAVERDIQRRMNKTALITLWVDPAEHQIVKYTFDNVAMSSRENPRFDIRDQRVEVKGRAERVFGDLLRAGLDASRSTIAFGGLDDRLWTVGTSVALDTRLDPAFPGNAVQLGAGWTTLHFRQLPTRVNRYTADARGYLRVFRQIVVAGRTQYTGADAALPPYERLLLGGSSSLRGFRTGTFDGDRLLAATAEVRAPITSVLSGAKLGLTAFVDAGKVWNVGESMGMAEWHRGAGGGLFLIASIVRINIDIARGLETGRTRVHVSSGFTF